VKTNNKDAAAMTDDLPFSSFAAKSPSDFEMHGDFKSTTPLANLLAHQEEESTNNRPYSDPIHRAIASKPSKNQKHLKTNSELRAILSPDLNMTQSSNLKTDNIPKPPSSAKSTVHDSPLKSSRPTTRQSTATGRSPRAKRIVDSGQRRSVAVDPLRLLLHMLYNTSLI
jgi:hypothetical protein